MNLFQNLKLALGGLVLLGLAACGAGGGGAGSDTAGGTLRLAELGQPPLPTGRYTQLRLVLADNSAANQLTNSVLPTGGTEVALKTPSGRQLGTAPAQTCADRDSTLCLGRCRLRRAGLGPWRHQQLQPPLNAASCAAGARRPSLRRA
ncbi:MAG: hypothetical protein ACOYNZ_02635 [Rhodoferax sp.]